MSFYPVLVLRRSFAWRMVAHWVGIGDHNVPFHLPHGLWLWTRNSGRLAQSRRLRSDVQISGRSVTGRRPELALPACVLLNISLLKRNQAGVCGGILPGRLTWQSVNGPGLVGFGLT